MTTPTREQVVQWGEIADKQADDELQMPGEFHPDWNVLRDDFFATLARADLEAELESLRKDALGLRRGVISWRSKAFP